MPNERHYVAAFDWVWGLLGFGSPFTGQLLHTASLLRRVKRRELLDFLVLCVSVHAARGGMQGSEGGSRWCSSLLVSTVRRLSSPG